MKNGHQYKMTLLKGAQLGAVIATLCLTMFTNLVSAAEPESKAAVSLLEVPEPTQEELLDTRKNLARWHLGATMYDATENFLSPVTWAETDSTESMGALMTDDPTARYAVDTGKYRFAIDLGDFFLIERFNFKNFTVQGSVQLFYSDTLNPPTGNKWKKATAPIALTKEEVISPKFNAFEARYLMAVLDVTQAGDIGNLGAFGNLSIAEVRMVKKSRDENIATDTTAATNRKPVKVNYASLGADARVAYVSSGPAPDASSMIDDDVESSYEFGDDESENIIIVDLKQQREVNRVSMLADSPPGKFDFYVVNKLPDDVQKTLQEMDQQNQSQNSATDAEDDMAMIFNNGRWEPLLLAQNGDDALAGVIGFAGDALFASVSFPGDFFQSLSPTVEQQVDGSEERFRIEFSNLQGQFLIIRFTPTPGENGIPLRIYEISLMGDVSADDDIYERLPAFEFATGGMNLGSEPTRPVTVSAPPPNVRPPLPPAAPPSVSP